MTEETKMNPVTDDMICANDHSRVCKGDSGGNYFSYYLHLYLKWVPT